MGEIFIDYEGYKAQVNSIANCVELLEGIPLIHSDKKDTLLFEGLESGSYAVDKYRVIMEVLDNIISDYCEMLDKEAVLMLEAVSEIKALDDSIKNAMDGILNASSNALKIN